MRDTPDPERLQRTEGLPYDKGRTKLICPCTDLTDSYFRIEIISTHNHLHLAWETGRQGICKAVFQYGRDSAVPSSSHAVDIEYNSVVSHFLHSQSANLQIFVIFVCLTFSKRRMY